MFTKVRNPGGWNHPALKGFWLTFSEIVCFDWKTGMETQKANLQSNCSKEGQMLVAAGVNVFFSIFLEIKAIKQFGMIKCYND